jgi:hypothetical protein
MYGALFPPALNGVTKDATGKPRAKGEDFFASVAERYEIAYRRDSRRPILAMVEDYREEGLAVDAPTVTSWVRQARHRHGFLTYPGRPGKSGGEATKKLREWQRQRRKEAEGQ